jgi:glycosyltransferase involved in cell wall biosynthesis
MNTQGTHPQAAAAVEPHRPSVRPRLGVITFNPIPNQVPLYRELAKPGSVQLSVLYLRDHGLRLTFDPAFGVPIAWDIDLLSGYQHEFLTEPEGGMLHRLRRLSRWVRSNDVVVIHGHSDPWMLLASAVCRAQGVPYLLRGDSGPEGGSTGIRGMIRWCVARVVVSQSAGGLAAGQRNSQFYARYRAPRDIFAPFSVDNDRFAEAPAVNRAELLARWGLSGQHPVIMFCGKLQPRKRPLDLALAINRLARPVTVIFVGDGQLADQVRAMIPPGRGCVTGFINQAELPSYYHAADILVLPSRFEPWGLVVNEAMAAGVLPVVSDQVGCGPDLVAGIGEVYPWGRVEALTAALSRALSRIDDQQLAAQLYDRVDKYSITATVAGFEQAVATVLRELPGRPKGAASWSAGH